MPLPSDFAVECLYTSEAWYVHDLIEVNAERIVAVTDTTRLGHLVDAQRVWPGHPKHLPGAAVIQITGVLGQLHAIYGLNLRPTDGWVGFGTHVHGCKFASLGEIGPPVELVGEITRSRTIRGTVFTDYTFSFSQEGRSVYTSTQTAGWRRSDHRGPLEPSA